MVLFLLLLLLLKFVPAGSPSRGGDATVYVQDMNQPSLLTPFYTVLGLFLCFGPFNCISFHKFSQQLSIFSLCSSGLISTLSVLSTICLFKKVSFSPDMIPCGWVGSKHQLTNCWNLGFLISPFSGLFNISPLHSLQTHSDQCYVKCGTVSLEI